MHGMNPILSCQMWKIVVDSAVLYGCELWTDISENFIIQQWVAAQRIDSFDQQILSSCIFYSLGLIKMEKMAKEMQLLFWNRLSI